MPVGVTPQPITDDLDRLLVLLPSALQRALASAEARDQLLEVVLDLGRVPEARYPGRAVSLGDGPLQRCDLDAVLERLGPFGADNRAGIASTLHRISAIRNRRGDVVGLTCRVGRAVFGTVAMLRDLLDTGQSLLLLGPPGVGKTTALREIARVLADDLLRRVVVIDTSNEIAGDGDVPHPAIGRARRMQVARPELQHQVMIEAVENHMPEVIVIDEIGTELEAQAARTIAERGVTLVATAHGNALANLVRNPTLSDLVGGIQAVTLGDEEARRRGSQKAVLERAAEPTFPVAVELHSRSRWLVHTDVALTVDRLLRGQLVRPQERSLGADGVLLVLDPRSPRSLPRPVAVQSPQQSPQQLPPQPASALRVIGCGIAAQQLAAVALTCQLPIAVVEELAEAEVVLSLPQQLAQDPLLRRQARSLGLPILVIKGKSDEQVQRGLERLLQRHLAVQEPLANSLGTVG